MPQDFNVQRQTISLDALEEIGFLPNGENAITPKQNDIFSDFKNPINEINTENLKKELEEKEAGTEEEKKPIPASAVKSLEELADGITKIVSEQPNSEEVAKETEAEKKEIAKGGTVNYLKAKIDKGEFQTYNDFDSEKETLDSYLGKMSEKDRQELIDKNYEIRETKLKEEYQDEVFNNLPGHLKFVAKAIADGTMDEEVAYVALGRIEQTRRLDPKDEGDQEGIVGSYLQATQFGNAKEIAEQIGEWKENGVLDKKAAQMKPKLDKMAEEQLQYYAAESEKFKDSQAQAAKWYAQSVEDALKDGDLNGLKIGKKTQAQLYQDLMLDIKPSARDGRPMNALWRKLEQIQVVEPDFKHLMEINYLANHRDEFIEMIKQQGRNEAIGKVTKELKTVQGTGADRGQELQEPEKRKSGIVKQKVNPFDAASR